MQGASQSDSVVVCYFSTYSAVGCSTAATERLTVTRIEMYGSTRKSAVAMLRWICESRKRVWNPNWPERKVDKWQPPLNSSFVYFHVWAAIVNVNQSWFDGLDVWNNSLKIFLTFEFRDEDSNGIGAKTKYRCRRHSLRGQQVSSSNAIGKSRWNRDGKYFIIGKRVENLIYFAEWEFRWSPSWDVSFFLLFPFQTAFKFALKNIATNRLQQNCDFRVSKAIIQP